MKGMDDIFPSEIVSLPDGAEFLIRPIRTDDAPRLQAFHMRLSAESIYYRFLETHPVLLDKEAKYFTTLDYQNRMAIVATIEEDGDEKIVGVARYDVFYPVDDEAAEAAFVIEDRFQGKGLGTELMVRLAAYAMQNGVTEFVFTVHWSNQAMLKLLRKCGDVVERSQSGGVYDVRVRLKEFAL